jgi:hypothetical protein
MFQSGMSECIDGDIVITQIPYTAFYALLEYLYTGRLFAGASDLVDVWHTLLPLICVVRDTDYLPPSLPTYLVLPAAADGCRC